MPVVTRSSKAKVLPDFYRATKRPLSPADSSDGKSDTTVLHNEKKENTPTKKSRQNDGAGKSSAFNVYNPLLAARMARSENPKGFETPEPVIRARRCLTLGQATCKLVGREAEMEKLILFISENVKHKRAASLYVSGLPGTGKTMCAKRTMDALQVDLNFCSIWFNCMNIGTISGFYSHLCDAVGAKTKERMKSRTTFTEKDVEARLTSGLKMIVLCLDEVDQIQQKFPSLLSKVFRWPSLPGSNLVLLGIANSCDLADRCLKDVNLKNGVKPQLLHFRPYTTGEVVAIIKERLYDYADLLHSEALELCARKCAAVSGDIRKALDSCKIALERAYNQRLAVLSPSTLSSIVTCNTSDVLASLQAVYTPAKQNSLYGCLPLQQKLLFASTLSLSLSGCKQLSVGKIFDEYKRICAEAHVPPIGSSEVHNLCNLLESNGLLRKLQKLHSNVTYALNVNEKVARETINDDHLIALLMNEKSS